jgi:hypothetical protein
MTIYNCTNSPPAAQLLSAKRRRRRFFVNCKTPKSSELGPPALTGRRHHCCFRHERVTTHTCTSRGRGGSATDGQAGRQFHAAPPRAPYGSGGQFSGRASSAAWASRSERNLQSRLDDAGLPPTPPPPLPQQQQQQQQQCTPEGQPVARHAGFGPGARTTIGRRLDARQSAPSISTLIDSGRPMKVPVSSRGEPLRRRRRLMFADCLRLVFPAEVGRRRVRPAGPRRCATPRAVVPLF